MISLNVEKLTKTYNRKPALRSLSFMHTRGILGIAGANGSGKSTLLKCLAYLLQPSSGSFNWRVNEEPFGKVSARTSMGYAAPYLNLYEDLTLFENLEFLGNVSRCHHDKVFYEDLLAKVQMGKYVHTAYKSLSTGQQQRAKLAAALVREPKILLLDEPGSNLDTDGHLLVRKIVEEQSSGGTLVIIASNDPAELKLCDNVVTLERAAV